MDRQAIGAAPVTRQGPDKDGARSRKSGEMLLILAALCLLTPPTVFLMNGQNEAAYERLKERGVVARGAITRKWVATESYTGRGGRPRTRTVHRIEVAYDLNATSPYRNREKAKDRVASSIWPAPTTGDIAVSSLAYRNHAPGEQTMVIFALGDTDSLMLVEQLEFRTSWRARAMWVAGLGAIMIVGVWLAWAGWRKRFPLAPTPVRCNPAV